MARILLFLVVAFLVWLAIRQLRGGGRAKSVGSEDPPAPPQASLESIEQCAWCGVHAPAGTALSLPDGRIYCSEAHRENARVATSPSPRTDS